ncbi:MAG: DUF4118 domain-containing protein, partial [Vicinamibacteria bacterium]
MMAIPRARKTVKRYAAAGLFVALALGLRAAMDPWLGESLPLTFLFGAIAAAVWYGGYGTSVAAAIAGYFATDYWLIEPRGITLAPELHQVMLALAYGATCAVVIAFGGVARIARLKAESARRRLERELRVRKRVEEHLAQAKDRMAADLARVERLHEISTALLRKSDLQELLEHSLEAAIAITDSE